MTPPAEVQEKAPKPQGLLPKNVQSWVLIGLAFLMVAIMWLTGGKKPQAPAKSASAAVPVQAPLEVNETINELQNRIEELQRQQLVAQSALAQQTRLLSASPQDPQEAPQQAASGNPPEQRAEDPLQAERKRRAYVSLFASNVALTYRKAPPARPAAEPETAPATPSLVPVGPDSPQVAQLLKQMQPNPVSSAPGARQLRVAIPRNQPTIERRNRKTLPPCRLAPRTRRRKTYVLFEGTILETVLINRLDGGFAGPVECLLSTDVYSSDRQHLLIPAGRSSR